MKAMGQFMHWAVCAGAMAFASCADVGTDPPDSIWRGILWYNREATTFTPCNGDTESLVFPTEDLLTRFFAATGGRPNVPVYCEVSGRARDTTIERYGIEYRRLLEIDSVLAMTANLSEGCNQ